MKNMEKRESPIQIEKDSFVSLIEENLKSLSDKSKTSIYVVPERLRSSNEEAYSPKVVSIGPIHYGPNKPAFLKMEACKLFFLEQFLKRTSNLTLTDYSNMMKEKEEKLRSCYSDSETLKGLNSEEFLKIILIDATFIIEYLLRYISPYKSNTSDDFDDKFGPNSVWLYRYIHHDLFLLENQIPYFILVDLYDLIKHNLSRNGMQEVRSFKELIRSYLEYTIWGIGDTQCEHINDIQHLLDFVWQLYVHQQKQLLFKHENVQVNYLSINSRSTTQLNDCGVRFRQKKTHNLFEIEFDRKKGILYIPRLTINDYTVMIFRNLVAYEQCYCGTETLLVHYIDFINNLVNTQEDVQLLVKKGIFVNRLGDKKDVASFINKLGEGLMIIEDNYFAQIRTQLDEYCRKYRHKWKGNFSFFVRKGMRNMMQNYLNNPWIIFAVVASTFLLILTVIQTVYSVLTAYKN